ncbi:hypothetical protein [Nostoc sp.]
MQLQKELVLLAIHLRELCLKFSPGLQVIHYHIAIASTRMCYELKRF